MNQSHLQSNRDRKNRDLGFASLVTIVMMMLLALISFAILSLSAVTLRSSSEAELSQQARANAKLALAIALGELQKQMGPDSRVSAESSILDQDSYTPDIVGVPQARWLAAYDSWGSWLNEEFTPPGETGSLRIQETYNPGRTAMFRRWLLSMPEGMEQSIDAPRNFNGGANWVTMVGQGSLGEGSLYGEDEYTQAFRQPVGDRGRHAWWIGAENQKALVTQTASDLALSADQSATSQGNVAEIGVDALDGFSALADVPNLEAKIPTTANVAAAGIDKNLVNSHFFNITASSRGLLTSVRTGTLKKDLSLLFEQQELPDPYNFRVRRDNREPSIRPMTPELVGKSPALPNRHFQSWTNMRNYYRLYHSNNWASSTTTGTSSLNWSGSKPSTGWVTSTGLGDNNWDGANSYWRMPILAKITYIYSLLSEGSPENAILYHVFSPVYTFWNPYNVEMQIPSGRLTFLTSPYKVWPFTGDFYLGNTIVMDDEQLGRGGGTFGIGSSSRSTLITSQRSRNINFAPGEFKIFSHSTTHQGTLNEIDMAEGFDPGAIGGEKRRYPGTYSQRQNPGLSIRFSHSYGAGNINLGNTGGSIAMDMRFPFTAGQPTAGLIPANYANDWFQKSQTHTPITIPSTSTLARWAFDNEPMPFAFAQMTLKGVTPLKYESIRWAEDWRGRNWLHSPPHYFGGGMYMSEDNTIAHTQRLDNPFVCYFGPLSNFGMGRAVPQRLNDNTRSVAGAGESPIEQVTSIATLELPTAPISSLGGFGNMRINPGWMREDQLGSHLQTGQYRHNGINGGEESLWAAKTKIVAYQSGVTGPGIGNSFIHPMIPRSDIYRFIDNSKSEDVINRTNWQNTKTNDSKAFCDYWDHVFLLNDSLWDDYFVSSLADQTRPGASDAQSLSENLSRFVDGEAISNSRFRFYEGEADSEELEQDLSEDDAFLRVAKNIMVEGMFNVNSTSVEAWYALFAGIRERKITVRGANGNLDQVDPPSGTSIALSRFETELTSEEMTDVSTGVPLPDGTYGWSGVRYLTDDHLQRLAEECVKQVKLRGPFLNFSEFVNRRLSDDELGLMGALQSAIDYDDGYPDPASINYLFKSGPGYMISPEDLGETVYATPEAVNGSRFAGIPGYVIQSDILRPLANTLSVRDDTFRVRGYGEALNADGSVAARAWCEAIVQRLPEYVDPSDDPEVPFRQMAADGTFEEAGLLNDVNEKFGRRLRIESFRWLSEKEV